MKKILVVALAICIGFSSSAWAGGPGGGGSGTSNDWFTTTKCNVLVDYLVRYWLTPEDYLNAQAGLPHTPPIEVYSARVPHDPGTFLYISQLPYGTNPAKWHWDTEWEMHRSDVNMTGQTIYHCVSPGVTDVVDPCQYSCR